MNKHKIDLTNTRVRDFAKKVVEQAKSKKLIKPISAAFKDIPTTEEIHKGKKEYFIDRE